jgi:carboxypeptidase family protein
MTSVVTWLLAVLASVLLDPSAQTPATPQVATGAAKLSGRVTAASNGRPLRAVLELVPIVGGVAKRVRADPGGRFEFVGLSAATYRLTAAAEGFVTLQYGQRNPPEPGRPIELKDGDQFDKADFTMPRASAVEGHLIDEFGDPAPGVEVQVARVDFIAGKRRLMPASTPRNTRPTDDLGRFRIYGLPPGDYYLMALSGPFATGANWAGFAPTYYPGTTSAPDARAIHLDVGQDVVNLSFSLMRAQSATVSGKATGSGGQLLRGSVSLYQLHGGDVRAIIPARAPIAADGSFTFRNVPFGTYVIQYGVGSSDFGSLSIVVDREAISDLTLNVTSGATLRGTITWEDGTPPPAGSVRIGISPLDFVNGPLGGGGGPPSRVNPDGTFEVTKLFGRGLIRVDVRSGGFAVKKVTRDGNDVTDVPIEFRGDIAGVDIVMTGILTTISGMVSDGQGTVSECNVLVFAEDKSKWTFPSRFIQLARPNQQGRFSVAGLPPETYLVAALAVLQGTEWQDPEFLDKLRAVATRFTIVEGESKTIDLKIAR